MNLGELVPPPDLPAAGARVPGVAVRLVLAGAGVLLTLVVYGSSGWLAVGIIFSLLAAWAPEYLLAWVLIVFLALGQLSRPAALSWQLLVLLAGVHLLHVLATLALGLPWRSWIAAERVHAAVTPVLCDPDPGSAVGRGDTAVARTECSWPPPADSRRIHRRGSSGTGWPDCDAAQQARRRRGLVCSSATNVPLEFGR